MYIIISSFCTHPLYRCKMKINMTLLHIHTYICACVRVCVYICFITYSQRKRMTDTSRR
ncbi:uncharacterized protein BX663DRAFT_287151 [Cokeromyces recurvatus]|uniref:uncharacterized protein n=1 Tax=Cokeromyces recurvatus TaxID=90255 RepID=UPI00221F0441|nr:uncharacterized protein BX663DRAFT_287151 [Cokeromyces recurvatus]KAI7905587.1 hypothetical protein BX663DRAFT_287151 [Cokeromyces recurvatus]